MPIPPTGTFRILAKVVASINGQFQLSASGGNCAADIVAAASSPDIATYLNANLGGAGAPRARQTNAVYCGPPDEDPGICFGLYPPAGMYGFTFNPATDEFIFNPGGNQIVVDTLTSDFPLGFMCTALQVVWNGSAIDGFGLGNDLPEIRLKYSGLTVRTASGPDLSISSLISLTDAVIPDDVYQGLSSALGIFGVEADIEENSVINTACGDFDSAQCTFSTSKLYVQGEYILWSAGLALTPPTVDRRDLTDTVFTLTDTEDKLLQLTNLYVNDTAIEITNIITHTAGVITFTLPASTPITPGVPIMIVAEGDGTEFSGTTNVGLIYVIRVDGSGIYKLIPGQTYDKVYNRDADPVVIDDVKIPDPFGRTGFF